MYVLQCVQWLGVNTVGKRHRAITSQPQVLVSLCVDNFCIEFLPRRVWSDDRKQGSDREFR